MNKQKQNKKYKRHKKQMNKLASNCKSQIQTHTKHKLNIKQ